MKKSPYPQIKKTKATIISASLAAYREESIISFLSNLMLNSDIEKVDITKIEKKERENQYVVSIILNFKKTPVGIKS